MAVLLSFIYVSISILDLLGGNIFYKDLSLIKYVSNLLGGGDWHLLFQWGYLISMSLMVGFGIKGVIIGAVISYGIFWMVFRYLINKIIILKNKITHKK